MDEEDDGGCPDFTTCFVSDDGGDGGGGGGGGDGGDGGGSSFLVDTDPVQSPDGPSSNGPQVPPGVIPTDFVLELYAISTPDYFIPAESLTVESTFTEFPFQLPNIQIPQFDPGPVLRKILDKVAKKAIPASPWPTSSGIATCAQKFFDDVTDQINNHFPNVSQEQPIANFESCMQRVIHGMLP
jgi:hypothetical protein